MKVALVTGGSRGIGRALVTEFAEAGYAVAFTYAQNTVAAEELAAQCSAEGKLVMACQADVRDYALAAEVVKRTRESLGPLNVLINNAGIRRDGAFHKMEPEAWREVMETNLTGAFNYARAVMPEMLRGGGAIINVSSVSGIIGMSGQTNYSASKAGLIGFTKALAKEVARLGVRVNAIAPGFIDTEMTASIDEAMRKKLFAQIPMGQLGTAQQVARLALYLAGDDAAYITGQVIALDGGLT
ncbi:MAG: hypothetical protein A3F68_00215 [Acidobacteria bacterium RIFCSPLOWO2_12_FULL_54_10]|nr:MAG: hypothetical protein A3F68_00215 [Acidobacteria bacterium RIFCSPLOWO2_12_FULL_54_10]